MTIFSSFLAVFAMYSVIKVPFLDFSKSKTSYVFCFFPMIGFCISFLSFAAFHLLQNLSFSPLITGVILAFLPVFFTGGIHLDGFVDTCDAYFSYASHEKKAEILKDPHVGAFGIISLCSFLILNVAFYTEIVKNPKYFTFILASFVISRCISSLFSVSLKPSKTSGLLYMFTKDANKNIVKITMISLLIVIEFALFYLSFVVALIYLLVTLLSVFWICRKISKDFGGISGDLAGFTLIFIEFLYVVTTAVLGVVL